MSKHQDNHIRLARAHAVEDAETFLNETPREDWEDAIKPGTCDADEGLINACGAEAVGQMFGLSRVYAKDGSYTHTMSEALAAYAVAWREAVGAAVDASRRAS